MASTSPLVGAHPVGESLTQDLERIGHDVFASRRACDGEKAQPPLRGLGNVGGQMPCEPSAAKQRGTCDELPILVPAAPAFAAGPRRRARPDRFQTSPGAAAGLGAISFDAGT